jgi:hypothetical protein
MVMPERVWTMHDTLALPLRASFPFKTVRTDTLRMTSAICNIHFMCIFYNNSARDTGLLSSAIAPGSLRTLTLGSHDVGST